jgi:DNA-binding transcriptional MerR regulator
VSTLRPIGAVVAELREEFPDLTASKIRYLEGEGLIEPLRTSRGSRRYADTDVEALRRVLRFQRDEFLPLAIIRDRLRLPEAEGPEGTVPAARLRPARPRKMSAAEVAQRGGVDAATLEALVSHGLVGEMDSTAVEVCRLVSRLGEFGIEPRHLRSFRVAADREVGLVQQAMAPRRGSASVMDERQLATELLALLLDLHVALVRQRSSSLEP